MLYINIKKMIAKIIIISLCIKKMHYESTGRNQNSFFFFNETGIVTQVKHVIL